MKITFVYHSCYVIELNDKVLVFDYYKGNLPKIDANKKVYFFVSHSHYDHYNEKIFDIYPDNECKYILSSDCFALPSENVNVALIDELLEIDDIKLKTFKSTDLGVAYLVYVDGICIYHAGDLNAWCFEDYDLEYLQDMKNAYVDEIKKLADEDIDIAFIPLDGRLGKYANLGIDLFVEHNQPKIIFPIHMGDNYDVVKDYLLKNKDHSHNVQSVFGEGFVFIQ